MILYETDQMSGGYLGPSQSSMAEIFVKIVHGVQPLIIFTTCSTMDV